MTTHVSALMMKARRLGLRSVADLHTLAVQRGCWHYRQGGEPEKELVPADCFSDEELALALLDVAAPYSPHSVRLGAAMLGADENDPRRVVRLARMERSEPVVRYVAECGAQFEPDNEFWRDLLEELPAAPVKAGVLPHPTRFVAMNGFERGAGPKVTTEWQRPRRRLSP